MSQCYLVPFLRSHPHSQFGGQPNAVAKSILWAAGVVREINGLSCKISAKYLRYGGERADRNLKDIHHLVTPNEADRIVGVVRNEVMLASVVEKPKFTLTSLFNLVRLDDQEKTIFRRIFLAHLLAKEGEGAVPLQKKYFPKTIDNLNLLVEDLAIGEKLSTENSVSQVINFCASLERGHGLNLQTFLAAIMAKRLFGGFFPYREIDLPSFFGTFLGVFSIKRDVIGPVHLH